MKVLVLNAGSSSMKFTLYAMENEQVLAKGLFERLGTEKPNMIYKRPDGYKFEAVIPVRNHVEALKQICAKLVDPADGVRIPELFKLRFNAGIIDDGIIKPRNRRILLDIAILRQKFDPL